MTVNELIQALRDFKDEGYGHTRVMFACDNRTGSNATQAFAREAQNADLAQVQYSTRHRADIVLGEEQEGEAGQFVRDCIVITN